VKPLLALAVGVALVLIVTLVATGCGAAKPSSEDRAGIAFSREKGDEWSTWAADADGSNVREIVKATDWTISPDGRRLAYRLPDSTLYAVDVAGGEPTPLGHSELWWWLWSPDSRHLAVEDSSGLFLVDVESGTRRQVVRNDRGDMTGRHEFSFAPDGKALVYADADIFVLRLSDGTTKRLTHNGGLVSDSPVWGRDGIVYRQFRARAGEGAFIGDLKLIRPDGSGESLFARADETSDDGLVPLEFSEDGKRLLACNAVDISCRPVTFTFPEGKRHELSISEEPTVVWASDLSGDGSEVLVEVGPEDGRSDAYAIPFAGGPARLIVKDAHRPSWARFPQSRDDSD
jgi:hypothetical protein